MTRPATMANSKRPGKRSPRLLKWVGGSVLVLVLLFVLIVFVLPNPAARYVIESQLDRLGIQHDGIDTVEIDLWNSRVSAGPVEFRSGGAEEGKIGEAGFQYSFRALLKRQAFIQLFFLRGVDIRVTRAEDGLITLNGIEVAKVAREQAVDQDAEAATKEKGEPAIGAGIESFEFTDSQLVFEDLTGGTLTVEVERLALHNFSTWEPEVAGTFELQGTVNGFELEWSGNARPLAEPITVELNTRMRDITLERIAQFIGPTGLERQEGSLETEVHYNYSIHGDGRVEGTADGTYTLIGFDIATADGQTFEIERAQLEVDVEQAYAADGSASTTGKVRLQASPLSLSGIDGDQVELGEIQFTIDDLSLDKLAEQRVAGEAGATAVAEAPTGPTPTVVQLLVGWAEGVARKALHHHLEIDGSPAVSVNGGQVRLAPRGDNPGQELSFGPFSANLGDIDSQTVAEGWTITAAMQAAVEGIRAASGGNGAAAKLAKIEIGSESVELKSDGLETALAFDLATTLTQLDAKDGRGLSVALGSFEARTDGMTVIDRERGGEIEGPIVLALKGLQATVPGTDRTSAVTAESLTLNLPQLKLEGEEIASAAFSGRFEVDTLAIEDQAQPPVSLRLESLQTDLENFLVDKLAADAVVEGAVTTRLSNFRLNVGEGGAVLAHSAESAETRLDRLTARGGEAPTIDLSGAMTVSQTRTVVPIGGGETAETNLGTLQVTLSEMSIVGAQTNSTGDLEITNLVTQSSGEPPQSIEIGSLAVKGMKSVPDGATEIESIQVGGLVAMLSDRLWGGRGEADEASDTKGSERDEPAGAAPGQNVPLRLGQFSILPGGRVEVTDRSVEPPMKLDLEFERLAIGPVDTAAPETRTQIALDASVNETATATIQGWATALKSTPDFDLNTRISALSLPPFSPYAATATGLNVETGELTADAKATASGGALRGQLEVLVDDLYLEPVSDERAKELEASVGVPVGFALGILKNDEGRIDLSFPVAGTLEAPEVDYSEVISKAVSGAMASLFPANWFGADGGSFDIEPATFQAGTVEITEQGKTVTDQVGELFADNPNIKVRTCGKATADDLMTMRGEQVPDRPGAAEDAEEDSADADESAAASKGGNGEAVAKPNQQEVDALLNLALQRGAFIREYLSSNFGIDTSRIPECRTSYSIEDGKPPRAEFRL